MTLISSLQSFFKTTLIKRVLGIGLITLVVVSTVAPAPARAEKTGLPLQSGRPERVSDRNTDRPTTTRQWKAEARDLEGQPVERAKRIAEEAADAVEDWAELYPDVAERTIPALGDDAR